MPTPIDFDPDDTGTPVMQPHMVQALEEEELRILEHLRRSRRRLQERLSALRVVQDELRKHGVHDAD